MIKKHGPANMNAKDGAVPYMILEVEDIGYILDRLGNKLQN